MFRDYLYSLATDKNRGFIAGIIKLFLFITSLIYGLAVKIAAFIYGIKPYKLDCKVISVGNITLGGTGKTSLVEMIAGLLQDKGRRVAVLSRGYKRPVGRVLAGDSSFQAMGDEPYMLSRHLKGIPVIVDKNRLRAARQAMCSYQADTVVLDDGFQQWRINKDLDIVTIDATNPFGNSRLIPRGILREPLSCLRRADIFILTKVNLKVDNQDIVSLLQRINPRACVFQAIHKPLGFYKLGESRDNLLDPGDLRGESAGLVCGIADPESFVRLINNLGINIVACFKFPDHHIYTSEDLERIINELKQKGVNKIITTEKDSVRFPILSFQPFPNEVSLGSKSSGPRIVSGQVTKFGTTLDCFLLRIRLEVLENEIFSRRIHSLYLP